MARWGRFNAGSGVDAIDARQPLHPPVVLSPNIHGSDDTIMDIDGARHEQVVASRRVERERLRCGGGVAVAGLISQDVPDKTQAAEQHAPLLMRHVLIFATQQYAGF